MWLIKSSITIHSWIFSIFYCDSTYRRSRVYRVAKSTIDFLLVNWKLTVMSFFFSTVHLFYNMPIRPISATFFFMVHSLYDYLQSNQSNTHDGKNLLTKSKLFFNAFLFLSARLFLVY